LKSRWSDVFTVAVGTAARAGQSLTMAKDEPAFQTFRRDHQELLPLVPSNGFEDMSQVFFYLPFRNSNELGQIPS
jgi:hypothetical protein